MSEPPIEPPSEPSAPPPGWVAPPPPTAPAPPTGWVSPPPPAPVETGQGTFVIAGVGARIVAYLLDATLVSIVPSLLTLAAFDFRALFEAGIEAACTGGAMRPTMPITPQFVLVSLAGLGIGFLYFVGLWTSGGRATLGMRLLRMQVIDAATGGTLGLRAAAIRWAVLGSPLGLLALVEPLQAVAGPLTLLVLFVVLLTVIANDRRQGLHDRAAGSIVIRRATSGDGATAFGCLVLAALFLLVGILAAVVTVSVIGPQLPASIPDCYVV